MLMVFVFCWYSRCIFRRVKPQSDLPGDRLLAGYDTVVLLRYKTVGPGPVSARLGVIVDEAAGVVLPAVLGGNLRRGKSVAYFNI